MKTPEEQQLAEEQIKEIQIEYLYRIADFSIGELLKKFVLKDQELVLRKNIFLGYMFLFIKEILFGMLTCNLNLLSLSSWESLFNLYLRLN